MLRENKIIFHLTGIKISVVDTNDHPETTYR